MNLTQNQNLQNANVRERFKLHLIKDEEDLHNYKNLLNAMAALFYTNHKANTVQNMFKQWISIWRNKPKPKNIPSRAVPAIEIDTELANA